jgi:hypothetical protein
MALAALALPISTAEAAVTQTTRSDARGEAAAAVDLLSATWTDDAEQNTPVSVRVHVRDLTRKTWIAASFHDNANLTTYQFRTWKANGVTRVQARDTTYPGTISALSCRGLSAAWNAKADTVVITVPKACLLQGSNVYYTQRVWINTHRLDNVKVKDRLGNASLTGHIA